LIGPHREFGEQLRGRAARRRGYFGLRGSACGEDQRWRRLPGVPDQNACGRHHERLQLRLASVRHRIRQQADASPTHRYRAPNDIPRLVQYRRLPLRLGGDLGHLAGFAVAADAFLNLDIITRLSFASGPKTVNSETTIALAIVTFDAGRRPSCRASS
jgi:hypothetical protein